MLSYHAVPTHRNNSATNTHQRLSTPKLATSSTGTPETPTVPHAATGRSPSTPVSSVPARPRTLHPASIKASDHPAPPAPASPISVSHVPTPPSLWPSYPPTAKRSFSVVKSGGPRIGILPSLDSLSQPRASRKPSVARSGRNPVFILVVWLFTLRSHGHILLTL